MLFCCVSREFEVLGWAAWEGNSLQQERPSESGCPTSEKGLG